MAALPEAEREALYRHFALTNQEAAIDSLTRAQLRPAFDASDDWAEANRASFNNALPEPAKSDLNASEKARLLSCVVRRRALKKASQALSDEERNNVVRELIAKHSNSGFTSLDPADLRAAVGASDNWAVEHAGSF